MAKKSVSIVPHESARARRRGATASRPRKALVVAVCSGTMALATADSIAAVLSLTAMAELAGTQIPAGGHQWMGVAYIVPFAALLAAAGRLADLLGRRLLLGLGLATFTVSAFAAVASDSWTFLIAARAGQGIGAAVMIPASLGLMLCELPAARRPMAVAIWTGASGFGGLLLHAGGWWLAGGYGWRALFLPIVAAGTVLLLSATGLPRSRGSRGRLPDLLGLCLLVVGVGTLTLAISRGTAWGWTSPQVAGCAAGGLVCTALAVWRGRRHSVPVVEGAMWGRKGFVLGWAASVLYGLMSFPLLMVAPGYLREWGFASAQVGPIMVAVFAGLVISGPMAGWAGRRTGPRWLIYIGGFLISVACVLLLTGSGPSSLWLAAAEVLGVGLGALSIGAFSVGTLPAYPSQYAAAVGAHMTGQQLGGVLGVAGAAAILESPFLPGPLPGYTSVFAACLACAVLAGIFALTAVAAEARASRPPRESRAAREARLQQEPTEMVAIPRRVLVGLRTALVDVAAVADALLPAEATGAGETFRCDCHPGLDPLAARLVHEALAHDQVVAEAEVYREKPPMAEFAALPPYGGGRRSIETGPIPAVRGTLPGRTTGPMPRIPAAFGALASAQDGGR
ncbi:MFS transporter [Sinosporangium siamense]|uniref:Major facilitator superfamily (MFS) profile domain-containing protein n=1 Tax=Sinosporangium siamense TaxID=1367973 RepID=A0A919VAS3_9ACTN|nr:MFS transporter [Sinosporangium siamense]GII95717.1 hypothetical protein Ssi02_59480 [Sinosporangium siamense]